VTARAAPARTARIAPPLSAARPAASCGTDANLADVKTIAPLPSKLNRCARGALALGMLVAGLLPIGVRADTSTMRITMKEQPNALNPLITTQFTENYLTEAIFSGLTKLDDHERAIPDLAQTVPSVANGGISRDGKTIVYHLRRNARWQDGVPVTADDVVFTFAKIRDDRVPYVSRALYDAVTRVEARDPYTVVVHLAHAEPDAMLEIFVAGQNGEIVPKHLLDHVDDMLHAPFNAAPIGSGAYRLERWDRGSSVTLRANAAYFLGAPTIDRIVVSFVPDSNTRALSVLSHDSDLAPIEPVNAPAAAATAGVRVVSLVQPTLVYLHFRVDVPPLDDLRLRRALTLPLDRRAIADKTYLHEAEPATEIIMPESPFFTTPSVPAPNPAEARAALDAAGWHPGPDGIRVRGGQRLSIVITCIAGDASNLRTAVAVQSAWRDIGVESAVRPLPQNLLYGPTGTLASGDFSVALTTYSFPITPDRTEFLAIAGIPPSGYNYGRFRDKTLDALMSRAHYSLDPAERRRLYAQVAARVDAEIPVYPLVWKKAVFAIATRVDGVSPEPVNSDFWNVTNWRLH
jgi:peptide/nickel transport system substrate-binding protein